MRIACGALLMAFSLAALAAPSAEVWARWDKSSANKVAIDHAGWNEFLGKYVKPGSDGLNRVAYGKVTADDKAKLAGYLKRLQDVKPTKYARAEQRAYWINLYNATTVNTVLEHYPVESILKIAISPGLFAKGPWKKKLLTIEGEAVSLDDIEHRILRPIWKDPRTHYSVNCASVGCPNLATQAWTAGNLEQMLDAGARAYVNSPRGVKFENGKLVVSSIYSWFEADFGDSEQGVIEHLEQYAEPALAKKLAGVHRISGDTYDWTLNDAR